MPVPLTNACLAFAVLCAAMGADIGAIIVGGIGVLNQAVVEFAGSQQGVVEDPDGLG